MGFSDSDHLERYKRLRDAVLTDDLNYVKSCLHELHRHWPSNTTWNLLHMACFTGHRELVLHLLDASGWDVNELDDTSVSCLFQSASTGVTQLLLDHGADAHFTTRTGCNSMCMALTVSWIRYEPCNAPQARVLAMAGTTLPSCCKHFWTANAPKWYEEMCTAERKCHRAVLTLLCCARIGRVCDYNIARMIARMVWATRCDADLWATQSNHERRRK